MIDNVNLCGLKRYLGVVRRTPNDLVDGEVGRFPIQINACVRCIKYWLKLMLMEEHRLPLSCLLYTSPSPRDHAGSRMPSSA